MKKTLALVLAAVMLLSLLSACKSSADETPTVDPAETEQTTTPEETTPAEEQTPEEPQPSQEELDQAAADNVAALIDAIYVQSRTDETDAQCEAAKAAWDALTDAQKELVEGDEASPDYFGLDTGDASLDDARNQDEIGENELLVVSFGTSYNDSRVADIKGIEDALQAAFPDWSVRRAFTAQIIINHVQARDGEKIDNMQQALERAVANGVKNLVVQPTHLMHGAEYDEMCEAIEQYKDKFESVSIAEPLLGEVGSDATVINADKEAVAKAITAAAVADSGFESLDAAKDAGTADAVIGAAGEEGTYGGSSTVGVLLINQMATNMERDGLRQAMSLAIDRAAVVKAMADPTLIPAEGLVPHGIRTAEGGDFRQVNGAVIDNDPDTYQQRCQQAVTLLREAGFAPAQVFVRRDDGYSEVEL